MTIRTHYLISETLLIGLFLIAKLFCSDHAHKDILVQKCEITSNILKQVIKVGVVI